MQASQVAGLLSFVAMLVSGLLSEAADSDVERRIWYGVGLLFFFAGIASQNLKGWIGKSYAEMQEEIAYLEKLMWRWQRLDGTPIPDKERSRIQRRYQRLIESIQFHPDNPRR